MTLAQDATDYINEQISQMLRETESQEIAKAVDIVASARKIFVYGVGRSGLVARAFGTRLVQLGLNVFFVGDTITPIVEGGDVVLIVSNTGATMSAIQTANIARRVGASVLTITGNPTSKLAHASNIVICIPDRRNHQSAKLAPLGTLFEDATMVFLDGIVAMVMEKLGESEASMRSRHGIMV
jgi:6-phospho-3-hexuloisomerase